MTSIVFTADQVSEVARSLLPWIRQRRKIAFYGGLGAGKTTLCKAICQELGALDPVSSPTFSLINDYLVEDPEGKYWVHHIDLYRLQHIQEALDIGIEDYLDDAQICLIEWPQVIEPLLPPGYGEIHLEVIDPNTRKLSYDG